MTDFRVSIFCPYCKMYSSITPAMIEFEVDLRHLKKQCIWEKLPYEKWWIGVCSYCHDPVLV